MTLVTALRRLFSCREADAADGPRLELGSPRGKLLGENARRWANGDRDIASYGDEFYLTSEGNLGVRLAKNPLERE